jgi:hypothetical protein
LGEGDLLFWIYDIPSWLATGLITGAFVLVNALGVYFIRPYLRPLVAELTDENNLIGNVLSLYSVMFGLLMGTLAVVTYQNLSSAQQIADNESTAIAALYRATQNYPEPERTQITTAIKNYTVYVVNEAWPLQQRGLVPKGGIALTDKIQIPLFKFEPKTQGQMAMHQESLTQYSNFVLMRRARLAIVKNGIPSILWWTMASGSLVLMMLMWLFDASRRALLVLSSIAAFALGSMTGLIALMDNPFRGELSVSSDSYQLIIDNLMSDQK